jgi:predicted PurR-regulated permease PerM
MMKKFRNYIIFLVTIILLYFVLRIGIIRELIKLLFISFVLAYALRPLERKLVSYGINKKLSAIIIILGFVSIFLLMFIILIPNILKDGVTINNTFQQVRKYIEIIYIKLENVSQNNTMRLIMTSLYNRINTAITSFSESLLDRLMKISEDILSLVVIPVIVYYFISEDDKIADKILIFIPVRSRSVLRKIGKDIDKILGRYIISQFILSFVIIILTFLVLLFFKVDYALLLAIVNGIFNIIPYFGPLFGAIPAIFIAMIKSPQTALWVAACLYIVQQIEGDIISPKITGDSVSMHPLVVILLLIIGGKLGGFLGMVLAVPVGVIIKVLYDDLNYYIF